MPPPGDPRRGGARTCLPLILQVAASDGAKGGSGDLPDLVVRTAQSQRYCARTSALSEPLPWHPHLPRRRPVPGKVCDP